MRFSRRVQARLWGGVLLLCAGLAIADGAPLDWDALDRLERRLEAWSERQGEARLLALARSEDPGEPYTTVRHLFPYLLPQDSFALNLDMECAPAFQRYRQTRAPDDYGEWRQCLEFLWRSSMPGILRQALRDLAPRPADASRR